MRHMTCGYLSLIKARKPWRMPDMMGERLPSGCYFFSFHLLETEKDRIILKTLTVFPIYKKCPKMEFFFEVIREHMKTWSLMHWEASIVHSYNSVRKHVEQKWHSTQFFLILELVIFDRSTTSILFHGSYLRNSIPLHSPNMYDYF